jgi:hypothetical protein
LRANSEIQAPQCRDLGDGSSDINNLSRGFLFKCVWRLRDGQSLILARYQMSELEGEVSPIGGHAAVDNFEYLQIRLLHPEGFNGFVLPLIFLDPSTLSSETQIEAFDRDGQVGRFGDGRIGSATVHYFQDQLFDSSRNHAPNEL